jgi:hypothetical protein
MIQKEVDDEVNKRLAHFDRMMLSNSLPASSASTASLSQPTQQAATSCMSSV